MLEEREHDLAKEKQTLGPHALRTRFKKCLLAHFPWDVVKKTVIPARVPQTVLRCFLVGNRGCQVRARISASESCNTTSARCLCQDFCISSLYSATCARSLYAGLLSKISLSGSLRRDPGVRPLVQDHRISLSGCLRRDPGVRPLVQDH